MMHTNKVKQLTTKVVVAVCLILLTSISYAQNPSFPFLKAGNTFLYECFDGSRTVYLSHRIQSKDQNGYYPYRILLDKFDTGADLYYYADANSFSIYNWGPGSSVRLTLYTLDCKPGDSWQVSVDYQDDDDRFDYGVFQTTVLSVSETVSTSLGTFDNCIFVKHTPLNDSRCYIDYYIDKQKGIVKFDIPIIANYETDEEEIYRATYILSNGMKEKLMVSIDGCDNLAVDEFTSLPVTYQPEGGKVRYWAEGNGISVADGGKSVLVKSTEPGEGTVWAEYTTSDGEKVRSSKPITSLKLNSINKGDPLQIGLYDAKGRKLKALKTVPVKVEPSDKWDELNYRAADVAIVSAVPTEKSLIAVQGVRKGKTTIQAVSNCGANTGPPLNVEILNCDDEVIKELKRQASQLQSRLKSNSSQQSELISNDDFIQADKNGAKAIDDVAQGLQSVAIMLATPKAGGETTFYKGIEFLSGARSMYGHVVTDQNTALAVWETANMIAGDNMAQKVSSAVKTFTELGKAAVDLGGYLGTAFGVASQLAELMEQYGKTQKELEDVKRIMYEVCGRDEVNPKGDSDNNDGEETPKEDPKEEPGKQPKNEPKPASKNQSEAKEVPPNAQEPTSFKPVTNGPDKASPEPQDQTSKTDKSSSEPKTYSVGIDIEPEGECDCAPNLYSTSMLSPENSQATDEALRLMIGINDVQHCYNNFSEVTMVPLIKGIKSIEGFYIQLETFLNVSEKEREKEFEKLKASLLELELDKIQGQLFQVEEFRFASGGCGTQIKDKIHTGFKMK